MGKDYILNEIKLELTYRCLLKCVHCSSEACFEGMPEMSYQDADRIVRQAILMGVKSIAFSGGEPLLWGNLTNLIQICNEAKVAVTVYTSGVHSKSNAIIKEFKNAGLKRIVFSLYAATPTKHDAITLIDQSHEQTITAIELSKSLGLKTELHFVPMASNYQELPRVANIAKQIGIERVSLLRIVPQGRSKVSDGIILSVKQTQELRQLATEAQQYTDIRIGSPYSILLCSQSPKCMAGIDRLTIAPDLTISPCDAFKQIKSKDIADTDRFSKLDVYSLEECWINSPYLNAVRDFIRSPLNLPCYSCDDRELCRSGCTAQKFIKHGKLIKAPDPLCPNIRLVNCLEDQASLK